VDAQVGVLLEQLKQRGMDQNTMIVILSDHGESFGEHGLFQHLNALYWEAIHVPFIIYWPGHVPAGLRVDRPVSITSLPASLLDLAGMDPGLFPNPSLVKLWENPTIEWPDPVAELAQIPWSPTQNPSAHGAMKSVITKQWHYIVHEKFGAEIYDWNKDPQELNNLINQPDMQESISQIRDYLNDLLTNANN
jgi:arylsulfatase A-like enzyme